MYRALQSKPIEKEKIVRKMFRLVLILAVLALAACQSDASRINTQKGSALGADSSTVVGQRVSHKTAPTQFGTGVGTLIGTVASGDAIDQIQQAVVEAAKLNKRVIYRDDHGGTIEAVPLEQDLSAKCRQVTMRIWKNGKMLGETTEKYCGQQKTPAQ